MAQPRPSRRAVPLRDTQPPTARRSWALVLLIVVAGLLAYANSLQGPFVFDDYRSINENPSIRQWPTALQPAAQTPMAGRPLANLSLALNYALGGTRVQGYHLWNVGIHLLAALTLFGLLRRLLAIAGVAPDTDGHGTRATDTLALTCALVWLVHPLNSEAVDYVTQRTESMVGLFTLLTLYAAVRSWTARGAWPWLFLAVAANVCGAATKESAVVTPFLVILCDRVFRYPAIRDMFARRWPLYAGLALTWLVFLLLAGQTPFFAAQGFATHVSPWTYLLNQAPTIVRYLRLAAWPSGLLFDYGVPQALTVSDVWPSALALALLALGAVVAVVRVPTIGFWGAWFFITLVPASSLLPIPTEAGAERRMYLPLIALIVVGVQAAWRLALARRYWRPIASAMLVVLAVGTVVRNRDYRDGVRLWNTVLAIRPSPRAHANLALELRQAGRIDESIEHLTIAASADADSKHALGSALIERGRVDEGIAHLQAFVRDNPNDPHIAAGLEELGAALYQRGRTAEAIAAYKQLANRFPNDAGSHLKVANLLLSSRDYAGAADEYREVSRLRPTDVVAVTRRGLALSAAGRLEEAVEAFRSALKIDSTDVAAERGLIDTWLRLGRFADADAEARRLVTAYPNDAAAHNLLGITMAAAGRYAEATAQFETAVRLNPQFAEAQANLARAQQERRRP